MRLDGAERGHADRARGAHPPEVVAREVDDHHVLGVVLAAGAQRGARRRGALDRTRLDVAVAQAQVPLGRRRHDRGSRTELGELEEREVGCRVRVRERAVQRDGIDGLVARESAGEVHLVALARTQQLEHGVDPVGVLAAVEAALPVGGRDRRNLRPRLAREGDDRVVEQRASGTGALHADTTAGIDDSERVEAGEHGVGHVRGLRRRARATTRSAAWPSSNEHHPTQNPGVKASSAVNASAPPATSTSAGTTPTTVVRPRRTEATPAPGGSCLTSPDATTSAWRTGTKVQGRYQAGTRPVRGTTAAHDPRLHCCVPWSDDHAARHRQVRPRRYHDRTVRSPLAATRALSGRIVIALVVCALVMGAAVFRINSYIDDKIDDIPRVQVTTAAADRLRHQLPHHRFRHAFLRAERAGQGGVHRQGHDRRRSARAPTR